MVQIIIQQNNVAVISRNKDFGIKIFIKTFYFYKKIFSDKSCFSFFIKQLAIKKF